MDKVRRLSGTLVSIFAAVFAAAFVSLFVFDSFKNVVYLIMAAIGIAIVFFVLYTCLATSNKKGTIIVLIISSVLTVGIVFLLAFNFQRIPYYFGKEYRINTSADLSYCEDNNISQVVVYLNNFEDTGWYLTESITVNHSSATGGVTKYCYGVTKLSSNYYLIKFRENKPPKVNSLITLSLRDFDSYDSDVANKVGVSKNGHKVLYFDDSLLSNERFLPAGLVCEGVFAIVAIGYIAVKAFNNIRSIQKQNERQSKKQNYVNNNNEDHKSDNANTKEPFDSDIIAVAQQASDDLIKKNLSDFMMHDYIPQNSHIYLKTTDSSRLYESLLQLMMEILHKLNLTAMVYLKLTIDDNNVPGRNQAGTYKGSSGFKEIQLNLKSSYAPDTIVAILCHECVHYFMATHELNISDTNKNEIRTDVMTCLLGFGPILRKGYKVFSKTISDGNVNHTTTHKVGYITDSDCRSVISFLSEERASLQAEKNKTIVREQMLLELDQSIETLGLLHEQLRLLEPIEDTIKEIRDPNLWDDLQKALIEYENSNLDNDISNFKSRRSSTYSDREILRLHDEVNQYCGKIAKWIAIFQGIKI